MSARKVHWINPIPLMLLFGCWIKHALITRNCNLLTSHKAGTSAGVRRRHDLEPVSVPDKAPRCIHGSHYSSQNDKGCKSCTHRKSPLRWTPVLWLSLASSTASSETFSTGKSNRSIPPARSAVRLLKKLSKSGRLLSRSKRREIQRPCRLPTFKFPGLHQVIREFVITGLLNGNSRYTRASTAFDVTHLGQKYRIRTSSLLRHMYISHELMRTVKTTNAGVFDDFTVSTLLLYLSDPKADDMPAIGKLDHLECSIRHSTSHHPRRSRKLLIPLLRETDIPLVHLLVYAAPVTRKMQHFDLLDFYATPRFPEDWEQPSWLPFELGILGG